MERLCGLRRGFLYRTAGALLLCALFGVLLIIPSVSSEVNTPLYSDWYGASLEDSSELLLDDTLDEAVAKENIADFNAGSFSLHRPQSELFLKGLWGEVYDIAANAATNNDDIENYLQVRARAQLTDEEAPDFRTWLISRGESISDRVLLTGADYLTNYLTAAVTDSARGLRFVRTVEWDYQTSLGDRRWQSGLSALGALREGADDAVVWQLRGYAAEDSGVGANAGVIYRRAVDLGGNALLGANVFLDYEKHGDYDEDFWRWSVGGEYRNAYLDIYLNRYFPITDGIRRRNGNYIYTQGGQEAYLNLKAPDFGIGQVSGGLTYYQWEGEYGDADDKGFRYHIGFSPRRGNLNLEIELDSPDGGSVGWGGQVGYRRIIGSADKGGIGAVSAGDFDAQAHFFDAVRREYAQRIRDSGDSISRVVELRVLTGTGATGTAAQLDIQEREPATGLVTMLILPAPAVGEEGETHTITLSAQTVSVTVAANASLLLSASRWQVTVLAESTMRLVESGGRMEVIGGAVAFRRTGSGLDRMFAGTPPNGTEIALLGTEGEVGVKEPSAAHGAYIRLTEGEVALTVASNTEISVEIVGVSATAVVDLTPDYVPPGATENIGEAMQITLGCSTVEQRDAHRNIFEGSSYNGCPGDVRINGLAEQASVHLHTQGSDLTLVSLAGGNGVAVVNVSGVTLSARWDSYPFYPQGATLKVLDDAVELSHGANATLSVEVDSTLAFAFIDTVAASIYAAILNGTVSGIDMPDGGGGRINNGAGEVGCSDNPAALSEGLVSVVAVCGDTALASGNINTDGDLELTGRVNFARTIEVTLSGGGGEYDFELTPTDTTLALLANGTAGASATGAVATLTLFVVTEPFLDSPYRLRATPRPPFDSFAAPAVINILLDNVERIVIANANEVVATVRTELDANIAVHQISHSGSWENNVGYSYVTPAPDSFTGLRGHFGLNAADASIIDLSAAIATSDLSVNPTEFPLRVMITDTNTSDSGLTTRDEIAFTVIVANPGDVKSTFAHANNESDFSDGDYVVYNRAGGVDIAAFAQTGNSLVGGISLSGLFNNSHYTYDFINVANGVTTAVNINGFVLVTTDAPGESAALRLTTFGAPPAALPVPGTYAMTVRVDDNHSAAEAFTVEISISVVAPLSPAGATEYDAGDRDIEGANEQIATISLANGFGAYSYSIPDGNVSPAAASVWFSVDAVETAPGVTMGVITFADDNRYRDSSEVIVIVESTDAIGGRQRYTLIVNVVAPLVVNSAARVPRQYVDDGHQSDFYTPPADLVSGGKGAHTYRFGNIRGDLAEGNFAIKSDDPNGGRLTLVATPQSPVAAPAEGNVAEIEVLVTDESSPAAQEVSYEVTVEIITNQIVFDSATQEWNVNYNQAANATVRAFPASWNPNAPAADSDGISYQLDPNTATNPVPGLAVRSNGEVELTQGAPANVDSAVVMIEASAAAGNVSGVPPTILQLNLNFHDEVAFTNPRTEIKTAASDNLPTDVAGRVLHTYSASGGTGDYDFSIINAAGEVIANAGGVIAIDEDSGALSQIAAVNTERVLELTIRVADSTPALGGSMDVEVTISWAAIVPVNPDGYMYILGGLEQLDVALSLSHAVWASADGRNWQEISSNTLSPKPFPRRYYHAAAVLNGTIFVSGGVFLHEGGGFDILNDVWSSGDGGFTWNRIVENADFPARWGHAMIALDDALYIFGGSGDDIYNEVWRSTDGVNWTRVGFGVFDRARYNFPAVVHEEEVYLIGGEYADGRSSVVLKTTPANLNRTAAHQAGPFRQVGNPRPYRRHLAKAVSYNGRIYLAGGDPLSSARGESPNVFIHADVWSSADGEVWRLETATPEFGDLEAHFMYVKGISMFIAAGRFENPLVGVSDVWSSIDGKHWNLVTSEPGFVHRWNGEGVVHTPQPIRIAGPAPADILSASAGAAAGATLFAITVDGSGVGGPISYEISPPAAAAYVAVQAETATETEMVVQVGAVDQDRILEFTIIASDALGSATFDSRVEWETRLPLLLSKPSTVVDSKSPHSVGGALFTVTASGGAGGYSYMIESVTPPSHRGNVEINANADGNGVASIAQIVTTPQQIEIEVKAADRYGIAATVPVTVNLSPPPRILVMGGQTESASFVFRGVRIRNFLVDNEVWSSFDGVSWSKLSPSSPDKIFSPRSRHAAATSGGTVYVSGGDLGFHRGSYAGNSSEVWSSADGVDWERRAFGQFPRRSRHQMLARGDDLFIIGGAALSGHALDDVWVSNDEGETWATLAAANTPGNNRSNFLAFVHEGSLVIAGGRSDRQVWALNEDEDPNRWVKIGDLPVGVRLGNDLAGLAFNDRMHILVSSDIWSSVDGEDWRRDSNSSPFGTHRGVLDSNLRLPIRGHRAVSLSVDQAFVVAGAYTERPGRDDRVVFRINFVWASSDGVNWGTDRISGDSLFVPELDPNPPTFTTRRYPAAVVFLPATPPSSPPALPARALPPPRAIAIAGYPHSEDGVLFTVTASSDAPPYRYAIESVVPGDYAGNVVIDAGSGVVSLTAPVTAAAKIVINIAVRDGSGNVENIAATVSLPPPSP